MTDEIDITITIDPAQAPAYLPKSGDVQGALFAGVYGFAHALVDAGAPAALRAAGADIHDDRVTAGVKVAAAAFVTFVRAATPGLHVPS
jgi:hypothetical protein